MAVDPVEEQQGFTNQHHLNTGKNVDALKARSMRAGH